MLSHLFPTPLASPLRGVFLCLLSSFLLLSSCEEASTTPSWQQTASDEQAVDLKQTPDRGGPRDRAEPQEYDPSAPELRFMAYNLRNYLSMPRHHDGQESMRPKPEPEITALIEHITSVAPAVLGLCEIGTQADLNDLQRRLKAKGLDYPYHHLSGGSDSYRRLALLSRYPLSVHPLPPIEFSLNGQSQLVRRGFIDATIDLPAAPVRFIGCHLKSKRESKYFDQERVRRNEAALLRAHINAVLASGDTHLLVYGDFNDTKQSPTIREITTNTSLLALDLRAPDGSRWTHHWRYQDVYSRFDYAFVSPQLMPRVNPLASYLVPTPVDDPASDHRPLVISLR